MASLLIQYHPAKEGLAISSMALLAMLCISSKVQQVVMTSFPVLQHSSKITKDSEQEESVRADKVL